MYTFKTIEQGAATTVLVATSPQLGVIGGRYFEDCNEAPVVNADPDATFGVAAHAVDPATAARLWEIFLGRPTVPPYAPRRRFAKGLTVHSGRLGERRVPTPFHAQCITHPGACRKPPAPCDAGASFLRGGSGV